MLIIYEEDPTGIKEVRRSEFVFKNFGITEIFAKDRGYLTGFLLLYRSNGARKAGEWSFGTRLQYMYLCMHAHSHIALFSGLVTEQVKQVKQANAFPLA